ncbi:hypothetical protein P7C70_g2323, partial [Phenoliferia sp. Uapishka_3]
MHQTNSLQLDNDNQHAAEPLVFPSFDFTSLANSANDTPEYLLAPASAYNWGLPLDLYAPKDEQQRACTSGLPRPKPTANSDCHSVPPPQAPLINNFDLSFQPRLFAFDQPPPQLPFSLPPPELVDSPGQAAPWDNFDNFFNFDDAGEEECPGLEEDLGDDDTLESFLFPSGSETSGSAESSRTSSQDRQPQDHEGEEEAKPQTPSTQTKARSTTRMRGPSTRATGFRGSSTKLVSLDAPIQSRQYHVPSATSKKRKTTAVERALLKRQGVDTPIAETPAQAATPFGGEDDEEIPDDLLAQAEKKRLSNTLAARKSRARKQGRLAQLEEDNQRLLEETKVLKRRVEELELLLKGVEL